MLAITVFVFLFRLAYKMPDLLKWLPDEPAGPLQPEEAGDLVWKYLAAVPTKPDVYFFFAILFSAVAAWRWRVHAAPFNVPHLYRQSYSRFLSPMASRTWIAQCSRSSPCHTFFVPGSCCREEGCDPTSRPRSMTTALMSGAFPSGILTTFR